MHAILHFHCNRVIKYESELIVTVLFCPVFICRIYYKKNNDTSPLANNAVHCNYYKKCICWFFSSSLPYGWTMRSACTCMCVLCCSVTVRYVTHTHIHRQSVYVCVTCLCRPVQSRSISLTLPAIARNSNASKVGKELVPKSAPYRVTGPVYTARYVMREYTQAALTAGWRSLVLEAALLSCVCSGECWLSRARCSWPVLANACSLATGMSRRIGRCVTSHTPQRCHIARRALTPSTMLLRAHSHPLKSEGAP